MNWMHADHLRSIPAGPECSFGRVRIGQSWSGLWWLEKLFRDLMPTCVVELGTGSGALSTFFGLHRPRHVATFDIKDRRPPRVKDLHKWLGVEFYERDVQNAETARKIMAAQKTSCLVFCDDGNKPAEVRLYAPLLRPGDILAVHDVGVEIHLEDVQEAVQGLVPWHLDDLAADNTFLAVWRKEL